MSENNVAVKGQKSTDELLIYANYVLMSYDSIFVGSHKPELKIHNDSVSIMIFDMALLYLKYDLSRNVICVASIFDECSVVVIAELICMLKDIFKENVIVNEDPYIQDPAGESLIWGRDNIDIHHEKVWGRKVSHTIYFDDSMAGHS